MCHAVCTTGAISGYAEFAEVISFFFLVAQVLVLLELAYRLQGLLSIKIELRDTELRAEYSKVGMFQNCWKWLYILIVLGLQVASFAMLGWLIHASDSSCHTTRAFLGLTITFGIVFTLMGSTTATVVCLEACLRLRLPRVLVAVLACLDNRGLMPPSVVFAYV